MFLYVETRFDAFQPGGLETPPRELRPFVWHYLGAAWPAFSILLVLGLLYSGLEVMLMAFVGRLVDLMRAETSPAAFFDKHWATLALMSAAALIARPLLSLALDLTKNQMIAGPLATRIRWQQHRYVLRQSLGFFQNDFAGRIANKVMQNAPAMRESVVQITDALWYFTVHFVGALILFGAADWRLMLPLFGWLALYSVVLYVFVPRMQRLSTEAAEARSMLTGRIVDSYTNIQTVKLFAHTEREDAYARHALGQHLAAYQASLRNLTTMELVIYLLNGVLMVSATGLALMLWAGGSVTIGEVAVVTGLILRLVAMSGWIFWVVSGVFENLGTVAEGMETIARPVAVTDRVGAPALVVGRGEIRFEGIGFHYGREGGVIDDLSLTIPAGQKVGLVGRSGAGKSTLVALLLRFYDLEKGRILIDGQSIADVTQDSLRARIAMVTQDTSLLHRSIMDNILYGRPEAGEAAAREAARRAHAYTFIGDLEDARGRKGYEAHVGERGVKLSGGQRQRIAIARVLLKNAPIMVLDEATSALDSEVEAAIQDSLAELMTGKTVIAIAHRLSTIAAMDRLVVMDRGRIVEDGSHEGLIARGGLYAELWGRQSGGFIARDAAE
ncbi:MAG: ABC transporter ATP-binding protein [Hyphomicrobiaceae bacterium]